MSKHILNTKSGKFVLHVENGILQMIDLPLEEIPDDKPDELAQDTESLKVVKIFNQALEKFLTGRFSEIDFDALESYWQIPQLPFYSKVYRAVMKIKPGETMSYKEVAKLCGNENASRAVGGAMRNNPYPLLIPCHRVIGADGKMVGYAGKKGVKIKQKLLNWEKEAKAGVRFVF